MNNIARPDAPCIVACDMLTPYGHGSVALWEGLRSGRDALSKVNRFDDSRHRAGVAGYVRGIDPLDDRSVVMQMIETLDREAVPLDCRLILASTKGEIDLLQRAADTGRPNSHEGSMTNLLARVLDLYGVKGGGTVMSAACISSSAAMANAASLILGGQADAVCVVACDAVTEFVFSGFSSLMALDEDRARPFDQDRSGLSLGEGAAYAVLMSARRAKQEARRVLATVEGWGLSSDANHMTGPSKDGYGLARAIESACGAASVVPEDISAICAHGTGTMYNDSMELKAFKTVFAGTARPVFSIKGAIGHSMGAAGLVEALLCIDVMRNKLVPATINLATPDEEALGWATPDEVELREAGCVLSTNSGFGGANSALILSPGEDGFD